MRRFTIIPLLILAVGLLALPVFGNSPPTMAKDCLNPFNAATTNVVNTVAPTKSPPSDVITMSSGPPITPGSTVWVDDQSLMTEESAGTSKEEQMSCWVTSAVDVKSSEEDVAIPARIAGDISDPVCLIGGGTGENTIPSEQEMVFGYKPDGYFVMKRPISAGHGGNSVTALAKNNAGGTKNGGGRYPSTGDDYPGPYSLKIFDEHDGPRYMVTMA
jgi:hypothetical protein